MDHSFRAAVLAVVFLAFALGAAAQAPPRPASRSDPQAAQQATQPEPPLVDVFDLLRLLRHKGQSAEEEPAWDHRKKMIAFAPIVGYKPASGMMFGAGGNVAFFRGDPNTTRISSVVFSLAIQEAF